MTYTYRTGPQGQLFVTATAGPHRTATTVIAPELAPDRYTRQRAVRRVMRALGRHPMHPAPPGSLADLERSTTA